MDAEGKARIPGRKKTRLMIGGIILFIAVVLCLACFSISGTGSIWDGAFPSGEFHLFIEDDQTHPVPGAWVEIYRGKTREASYLYPFQNYVEGTKLISDGNGMIVLYRTFKGFEFGGFSFRLFWFIPMGASAPEFTIAVMADGYSTEYLPAREVFALTENSGGNEPVVRREIDGDMVELKVYEMHIVLKKSD